MNAIDFACLMEDITKLYSIHMPVELTEKIFDIYLKKAPIYSHIIDDYNTYYKEYDEYEEYIDTYDDIYNSYDEDEDIDYNEIDNDEIAYKVSQKLCKSY